MLILVNSFGTGRYMQVIEPNDSHFHFKVEEGIERLVTASVMYASIQFANAFCCHLQLKDKEIS